jgi:hypothetical protein
MPSHARGELATFVGLGECVCVYVSASACVWGGVGVSEALKTSVSLLISEAQRSGAAADVVGAVCSSSRSMRQHTSASSAYVILLMSEAQRSGAAADAVRAVWEYTNILV